jgi:hypothetical protein
MPDTPEQMAAQAIAWRACAADIERRCQEGLCDFCQRHGRRAVEAISAKGLVIVPAGRISELLDANNREVERRRQAMAELRALLAQRAIARALLHSALHHAERVSVLLNDLAAEMHRLDDAEPEGSTRFDAMAALLARRFTDCSGLPLINNAHNAGLLPDDLLPAEAEDEANA